ncbi:JPH2 protein, partial [Nothoprocta ornata]|nr:JPH2 protein [Nothoprocta pentlandii]NWX95159.1 JPH2 protein [Nothoprocta ornata]
AEHMEIKPLQRMAREPAAELYKGYHGYAVRTSSASPPADYEDEHFPEPKAHSEPVSPEPVEEAGAGEATGDARRRGGTPAGHEDKPVPKVEAKEEAARAELRHKEPKQHRSPEHRPPARGEATAERKTETKALVKAEPKGAARKALPPAAVAPEAEECEEGPNTIVICMVILLNIGLAILFVHFLT